MNKFECINPNCQNVLYSDSNPKDVCGDCADKINGLAERGEIFLSISDIEENGL
jgi:hypothetical protein